MGKYFIHPSAYISEGRAKCVYCGAELPMDERGIPSLKTDFPCSVSVPVPFDDEIEVSVWDCKAAVLYKSDDIAIDISEFPLTEREKERLKKLARESIYDVGGSITWSGVYPPSEKLVKLVKRIVTKHRNLVFSKIQSEKIARLRSKIERLERALNRVDKARWYIKRAAQRYVNASERDRAWLKAMSEAGIFNLISTSNSEKCKKIREVKQRFPEYYETADKVEQDWTEDAALLKDGYVVIESDGLPA